MDTTKTMLGVVIGAMLVLGAVAYAESTYKADLTVSDTTAAAISASADKGKVDPTVLISQEASTMLNDKYDVQPARQRLHNLELQLEGTNNVEQINKGIDALQQILDDNKDIKPPAEGLT